MKKLFAVFLITLCIIKMAFAFPVLTGRVVDDAHILSSQQHQQLQHLLEQADPHQVVAVSLNSLEGQEIEEYGYQLGRHWGIGRKDINDGVLVLIAPNQRQLRIEVGYGLEPILTDIQCKLIADNIMLPLARTGRYGEALLQGSQAVINILNGQQVDYPVPNYSAHINKSQGMQPVNHRSTYRSTNHSTNSVLILVLPVFFLLLMALIFSLDKVRRKFKKYKQDSFQNRFLFFYENVLFNSSIPVFVLLGIFVVEPEAYPTEFKLIAATILSLIIGRINLSNIKRWRKNPQFPYQRQFRIIKSRGHGSDGGGDSSFSGGGGSSFSGGGGSFGGGGASGRW